MSHTTYKGRSLLRYYIQKLRHFNNLIRFIFIHKYYCPVCNTYVNEFNPLPGFYAENAKRYGYKYYGTGEMTPVTTYSCSNCGASDRERLYAYYLKGNLNCTGSFVFYHFSPEKRLENFIKKYYKDCTYKTFDLASKEVDIQADLTCLTMVDDNECDFFICSHVLEHIDDDRKAMAELFRITRPGGKGILMVPISLAIQRSIENIPGVYTDEERWRYYGQNDHVRVYSKIDFSNRVRESGFDMIQLDIDHFGIHLFNKLGLKNSSTLYVVQKN